MLGQVVSLSLKVYSSLSAFCLAYFQSVPHSTAFLKGQSNHDSSLKTLQHGDYSRGESVSSLAGHKSSFMIQALPFKCVSIASNDPGPCCLLPSTASLLKEMHYYKKEKVEGMGTEERIQNCGFGTIIPLLPVPSEHLKHGWFKVWCARNVKEDLTGQSGGFKISHYYKLVCMHLYQCKCGV